MARVCCMQHSASSSEAALRPYSHAPACACLCSLLCDALARSQLRSDAARTRVQESDLKQIFEPFGAVDYITLQHDGAGRSQGFGFVQCAPTAYSVALCCDARLQHALCCCSDLV